MDPLVAPLLSLWILFGLGRGDAPDVPRPGTPAARPASLTVDTDSDGIDDSADFCPGTPAGYPVLENGCPIDSDGDGVSDGGDRCPGTAGDAVDIDERGCSAKDRKTEWTHRYIVRSV